MLPFPLEDNLFLLSSEILYGVVLVCPRSGLAPGAWTYTSSRIAITCARLTVIGTFEPPSTKQPSRQMAFSQRQPIVAGVFVQPSAGLDRPLLQTV